MFATFFPFLKYNFLLCKMFLNFGTKIGFILPMILKPKLKIMFYALSFYVTKTVLVSPKWFWSDQIDLDLTLMIWSRPKWNGQDQGVAEGIEEGKGSQTHVDMNDQFQARPPVLQRSTARR